MSEFYLGIDIGTSSVKAILKSLDGQSFKARCGYTEKTPDGWTNAVACVLKELKEKADGKIVAISFSSQVGTYIVNGKEVIAWHENVGKEELDFIKSSVSDEEFLEEISMIHPDLISYPLPRFLYIKKRFGNGCEVMMPKDLLIREFTGNSVTDIFSMRGLANTDTCRMSEKLLKRFGISHKLPELRNPFDLAGCVTETACKKYGLDKGIPVYLGCNDFFAGLLGMGICDVGDAFDLSGTSEHIGYISENINPDGFVSGKYFNGFCTYGGTKSSGTSCLFAMENFGLDGVCVDRCLKPDTPIFLPYLNGERAPIFDENARGVYFGIGQGCDGKTLAYSTLEGVVFSLWDISQSMKMPRPKRLVCGGGSANDAAMNTLRASLYGCELLQAEENDTSALGACIIAMVGHGAVKNIKDAVNICVKYKGSVIPDAEYVELLKKRFAIYRDVYKNLKHTFKTFNDLKEIK